MKNGVAHNSHIETHERWMREAIDEAKKAQDEGNWGIGCVIVKENVIISRAHNTVYTNRDRYGHAEMNAIQLIRDTLFERSNTSDIILYTTYEPCIMCFGALLMTGIKKVYAGVDIDDSGVSSYINFIPRGFRNETYNTMITTGILARECAQVWFDSLPARRLVDNGYQLAATPETVSTELRVYQTPSSADPLRQ